MKTTSDIRALIASLSEAAADPTIPTRQVPVLDVKTSGLVGIGAAVALGASKTTYRHLVSQALKAGATRDECIAAALAVASTVGTALIVTAAPRLASALGYDIDRELEWN